ncbi:hypothetical protein BDY24DRAFT_368404 [Mrakia frigida]|uniref:uncharacterized protein n=1 Tax=Mrakia frigida TaxID=29902 RepID=UPI003FCC04B7
MNDPKAEIVRVVKDLTSTSSPSIQRETLQRYFHPNAAFNHPLCRVVGSPGSRDRELLRIYQWYRIMSPVLHLDVKSLDFDEKNLTLYLNITQTFHIFLSPFKPASSKSVFLFQRCNFVPSPELTRLLVRITLIKDPTSKLYLITSQTDFYQPEDVASLVFPPLATVINAFKSFATLGCMIWCVIFQWTLGWWVPEVEETIDGKGKVGEKVWKGMGEGAMEMEDISSKKKK